MFVVDISGTMRYTTNPKTKKTKQKQKQINEQCFNFQGQVEQNTKKGNVTSSNEIKVDLFGLFNVLDFIYFGIENIAVNLRSWLAKLMLLYCAFPSTINCCWTFTDWSNIFGKRGIGFNNLKLSLH